MDPGPSSLEPGAEEVTGWGPAIQRTPSALKQRLLVLPLGPRVDALGVSGVAQRGWLRRYETNLVMVSCRLGVKPVNSEQRCRLRFIEGLRAIAKLYEENPGAYYDGMHITLNMYVWGAVARQTLAQTARAFGQCNKVYDDDNVTVSRQFSEQVTVAVFAPRRKVCRRLVLGARMLPARTVPATQEVHIPAARVEIVEWQCDPLLSDDAAP
jgi:hypothetical protein